MIEKVSFGLIVEMRIVTLDHSGRIILAIDLVHEGVTWFSQAGSPCHRIEFRVI